MEIQSVFKGYFCLCSLPNFHSEKLIKFQFCRSELVLFCATEFLNLRPVQWRCQRQIMGFCAVGGRLLLCPTYCNWTNVACSDTGRVETGRMHSLEFNEPQSNQDYTEGAEVDLLDFPIGNISRPKSSFIFS